MVAGVEAAVEDLNTVKRGEGEDIVELKASVGIYQGVISAMLLRHIRFLHHLRAR